jgi:thymidine kinase
MQQQVGRIELITGPMFAGKTTELLRRVERAKLAHQKCAVIKYSRDDRYSQDSIATHDQEFHVAMPSINLMARLDECLAYDLIAIDEGQFFPDLVEFAEEIAARGKTLIVAGLDGSFQRRPFGKILELIARCESLTKLSAICTETGREACYTQRKSESQELEVIGGADLYCAASRTSFFGRPITGEVHLTMGPIHSGKTTELLRLLKRHQIANRKVVLITHEDHPVKAAVAYPVMSRSTLPNADDVVGYDVIGVDNGEKFERIAPWADQLANDGKLIQVSALDGDPRRMALPEIMELISVCEKVQKLDSVCPITGLPAPFSAIQQGAVIPISRSGLLLSQRMMQVTMPQTA